MNLKNAVIIGQGHLATYLHSIFGCMQWKKDMAEFVDYEINDYRPEMIINAAGKTDLKFCENDPHECFRCNVTAPLEVYRQLIKSRPGGRVPYIMLSSGCVWEGPYRESGEPFFPSTPVNPQCFYSWTKAICDQMLLSMQHSMHPIYILRPRLLYSHYNSPRNTLLKLIKYPKLLTVPNSITSVNTVEKTIRTIADTWVFGPDSKIINCYDANTITPYEIGLMLHSAGLREKPEKLEKSDLDSWHKPKRVDVVMQDDWFETHVQPVDVRTQLYESIEMLKENLNDTEE